MSSHRWGRFGAFVRPWPIQRKVIYLSSMLSLADGVNPAWELSRELNELSTVPDTGELSPKTICKETHSTEAGAGGLGAAGRAAACPAHPHSPTRWAWRGGGCLLCTDCQGSPSPIQVPTAPPFTRGSSLDGRPFGQLGLPAELPPTLEPRTEGSGQKHLFPSL